MSLKSPPCSPVKGGTLEASRDGYKNARARESGVFYYLDPCGMELVMRPPEASLSASDESFFLSIAAGRTG